VAARQWKYLNASRSRRPSVEWQAMWPLEVPRLSAVSVRSNADVNLADQVAGWRSWLVRKAVDGGPRESAVA
jgi:hypothetical protein